MAFIIIKFKTKFNESIYLLFLFLYINIRITKLFYFLQKLIK